MRDDGQKKGVTPRKRRVEKTPLLKYKGEKKIRKSCQTAQKRQTSLQKSLPLALVLVLKTHTHKE